MDMVIRDRNRPFLTRLPSLLSDLITASTIRLFDSRFSFFDFGFSVSGLARLGLTMHTI
jgi:hypothetical protein